MVADDVEAAEPNARFVDAIYAKDLRTFVRGSSRASLDLAAIMIIPVSMYMQ